MTYMTEEKLIRTILSSFLRILKENDLFPVYMDIINHDNFPKKMLSKPLLNRAYNPYLFDNVGSDENVIKILSNLLKGYKIVNLDNQDDCIIIIKTFSGIIATMFLSKIDHRIVRIIEKDTALMARLKLFENSDKPCLIRQAKDKISNEEKEIEGIKLGK